VLKVGERVNNEKSLPYMALWHDMHAGMYVWLVAGVSELGGVLVPCTTDWDKKEMGLWWWWEGKELLMGKGGRWSWRETWRLFL